jgi:hypothetical protein
MIMFRRWRGFRWRRPKDPQTWVEWMWHDHLWLMRWARVRNEARVLRWWILHPIQMYRHNRKRH